MNNSKFIVIESDILQSELLNNTDKILYGWIVALSQYNSNGCYATVRTLSELMNLKQRQVYYSIARLCKCDFITIQKIKIDDKVIRFIKPTINVLIELRTEKNKEKENKKSKKSTTPEWLGKEIHGVKASEEEIRELDEAIKRVLS